MLRDITKFLFLEFRSSCVISWTYKILSVLSFLVFASHISILIPVILLISCSGFSVLFPTFIHKRFLSIFINIISFLFVIKSFLIASIIRNTRRFKIIVFFLTFSQSSLSFDSFIIFVNINILIISLLRKRLRVWVWSLGRNYSIVWILVLSCVLSLTLFLLWF